MADLLHHTLEGRLIGMECRADQVEEFHVTQAVLVRDRIEKARDLRQGVIENLGVVVTVGNQVLDDYCPGSFAISAGFLRFATSTRMAFLKKSEFTCSTAPIRRMKSAMLRSPTQAVPLPVAMATAC